MDCKKNDSNRALATSLTSAERYQVRSKLSNMPNRMQPYSGKTCRVWELGRQEHGDYGAIVMSDVDAPRARILLYGNNIELRADPRSLNLLEVIVGDEPDAPILTENLPGKFQAFFDNAVRLALKVESYKSH